MSWRPRGSLLAAVSTWILLLGAEGVLLASQWYERLYGRHLFLLLVGGAVGTVAVARGLWDLIGGMSEPRLQRLRELAVGSETALHRLQREETRPRDGLIAVLLALTALSAGVVHAWLVLRY